MPSLPFLNLFHQPKNELEKGGRDVSIPDTEDCELAKQCPACRDQIPLSVLWDNGNTCPFCGYHFRISARQRLSFITDPESFTELWENAESVDAISFPGYVKKLEVMQRSSGEKEAVICGECEIEGQKCAIFAMEPYFMMGSMGTVVGEKITRLFEYAIDKKLPVIGYTVSGGARMQEGILSLMQMAKTSAAVKRHSDFGGLYIAVLTDPTTGGVTASFAMEADIILAEPNATVGFAGARVIEQTVRKKLPPDFQKSEFVLEHGFADSIVSRTDQRDVISGLIRMHERKERDGNEQ